MYDNLFVGDFRMTFDHRIKGHRNAADTTKLIQIASFPTERCYSSSTSVKCNRHTASRLQKTSIISWANSILKKLE
jgi:hypothetical protein